MLRFAQCTTHSPNTQTLCLCHSPPLLTLLYFFLMPLAALVVPTVSPYCTFCMALKGGHTLQHEPLFVMASNAKLAWHTMHNKHAILGSMDHHPTHHLAHSFPAQQTFKPVGLRLALKPALRPLLVYGIDIVKYIVGTHSTTLSMLYANTLTFYFHIFCAIPLSMESPLQHPSLGWLFKLVAT